MILRFDVALDGRSMSALADEIIIRDVIEEPEERDLYRRNRANSPGQIVTGAVRRSLKVRVLYVIRTQDVQRRAQILDMISAWAQAGGALSVTYRPGIALQTTLEEPPSLSSSLRWRQDLTLTFSAYEVPFWRSTSAKEHGLVTGEAVDGLYGYTGEIMCESTADSTPVSARMRNASGMAMTRLYITVGDTRFAFESMSVDPGRYVVIAYDQHGTLSIKDDQGTQLMQYRTGASDDDLICKPGANAVSVSADVPVIGTLSYHERYV